MNSREQRRGGAVVIDNTPGGRNQVLARGVDAGMVFGSEAERGGFMHAHRGRARHIGVTMAAMRAMLTGMNRETVEDYPRGRYRIDQAGRMRPLDPNDGYSVGAVYRRAIRPMIGGAIRSVLMPFLTVEDRLRLYGLASIAGAARESDIAFLPHVSAIASVTITSDTTLYFTVPAGHAFMFKGIVANMLADADATTGDETLAISVDYTLDGTNWVAVASEANLGGTLEAEAFLQYEPVTLPATTVASGLITAVHTDAVARNTRIPDDCTVRVVLNVTGTTPIFTNGVFLPFGIWL